MMTEFFLIEIYLFFDSILLNITLLYANKILYRDKNQELNGLKKIIGIQSSFMKPLLLGEGMVFIFSKMVIEIILGMKLLLKMNCLTSSISDGDTWGQYRPDSLILCYLSLTNEMLLRVVLDIEIESTLQFISSDRTSVLNGFSFCFYLNSIGRSSTK